MLHLKDMRRRPLQNQPSGNAPAIDQVAIGRGEIDVPAIIRTAEQCGVRHYFIEDETPTPLECIPESLQYLRTMKY